MIHQKQNVPYNTGKVQIGLLCQPPVQPMTEDEEKIQAALLGIRQPFFDITKGVTVTAIGFAVLVAVLYLFTH